MTSIGRCPRVKTSRHPRARVEFLGSAPVSARNSLSGARTRRAISRPRYIAPAHIAHGSVLGTAVAVASPAWVRVRHARRTKFISAWPVHSASDTTVFSASISTLASASASSAPNGWLPRSRARSAAERSAQQLFRRDAGCRRRVRGMPAFSIADDPVAPASPRAICAAQIEDRPLPGRSAFGNVTSRMRIRHRNVTHARAARRGDRARGCMPPGDLYRPTPAMLRSAAGRRGGERPRSGSCDRRLSATT